MWHQMFHLFSFHLLTRHNHAFSAVILLLCCPYREKWAHLKWLLISLNRGCILNDTQDRNTPSPDHFELFLNYIKCLLDLYLSFIKIGVILKLVLCLSIKTKNSLGSLGVLSALSTSTPLERAVKYMKGIGIVLMNSPEGSLKCQELGKKALSMHYLKSKC